MSLFAAIILGIVEGFTEFLPVSSTAHLILTSKLIGLPPSDFLTSFEIIIQLGAILAVAVLYGKKILANRTQMIPILAGFIPTMVIGLLLYKLVKTIFLINFSITLAGLLIGGIFLILAEFLAKKVTVQEESIEKIPLIKAAIIGVSQAIAVIPGMSRSAMTIGTGTLLGISREAAVEFSFLLAAPVMLGATTLDILESYETLLRADWPMIAVGFWVAFLVALVSINWLISFAKKHSLAVFGWYRVVLAVLLYLFW